MIIKFSPSIDGIVAAFIVCISVRIPLVNTQDASRDVRLVDGNSQSEGRVQVFYDGVWNAVCIEGWDNRIANVVCQTLGLGLVDTTVGYISGRNRYKDVISIHCTGYESDLKQCLLSRNSDCDTLETAGVVCKPFPDEGAVRVVDGLNPFGGRLEIYMEGKWGTVCDDHWDMLEMEVACKNLGFGLPAVPNSQSNPFEVPGGTGDIHMDDVSCTGLEDNLLDCQFIEEHNCQHHEDVVVMCQKPVDGMIRLQNSNSRNEGVVQVFLNNGWREICDIGWDLKEMSVICRQLGFAGPAPKNVDAVSKAIGSTFLYGVQCKGSENEILGCKYSTGQDCVDGNPVRAACHSYVDGDLRLMGSDHPYSGRVEVFLNGNWGTVCDDGWGIQAADITCKQLGMGPASSAPPRAFFGQGSGPVNLDNVRCKGSEESLLDCPHVNASEINCGHDEDAGVVCTTLSDGDARLENSSSHNEGLIELYLDGQWAGICVNDRTLQNGNVACRQLGYRTADSILVSSEFGRGSSNGNTLDMACLGNETSLTDCMIRDQLSSNCTHSSQVLGVVCTMPEEGAVRLRGTNSSYKGRVEVFIDGEWGSICDDDWDIVEAEIVCHQLGFTRALEAKVGAHFGHGQDPTHLDNVGCIGYESNLLQCSHVTREKEDCLHSEDAGVICENTRRDISQIRLSSGDDTHEGRLEVFMMGTWGTVCDNNWNMNDANVVCKQLGFEGAEVSLRASRFGQAGGQIHIRNPVCSGNENSIFQCPEAESTGAECGHSEDVAVVCETAVPGAIRLKEQNGTAGIPQIYLSGQWGGICADDMWDISDAGVACRELGFDGVSGFVSLQLFIPTLVKAMRCSGFEDNMRSCTYEITDSCDTNLQAGIICQLEELPRVRLGGTYQTNTGRVEVFMNGQWGSVCDEHWGLKEADVVCRELGFASAEAAQRGSPYGDGYGSILMTQVRCDRESDLLASCAFTTVGLSTCNGTAGVVCTDIENGALRLVDGSNPQEGRVEIYLNREWGTVCDDLWDHSNAAVVCRQLGIRGRASAVTQAAFGQGSGSIVMDDVRCVGSEQRLSDCQYLDSSSQNCGHDEDAGVRCGEAEEEVTVRLAGGQVDSEGRVEVFIGGIWGTVCDDYWDINDAHVVCRQLGFSEALEALSGSRFGPTLAPILLDDVQCVGNEATLTSCVHIDSSRENCNEQEQAGVRCYNPAHGEIRLTAGHDGEGTVEIFLNGLWRNVCDTDWGMKDGRVVCHQLGFGPPSHVYHPSTHNPMDQNYFINPTCLGNEPELIMCSQANSSRGDCFYVGVVCSEPETGQIRLVNGNLTAGRVEIYLNEQWNTVCDDFWELNDAHVVCRQLGFSGAVSAPRAAYFGRGVGRIGMDNVACFGSEKRLTDCRYVAYPYGNCVHDEDAGVICASGGLYFNP